MIWTPVKTEPLPPIALKGAKGGGGMEIMIGMVKFLTAIAGIGPPPPPQPRGYFGFELTQDGQAVSVANVLADSPAAKAGLEKGDRILKVETQKIEVVADVLQHASKITAGKMLTLTIERDSKQSEIKITAGEGL
jgi:S1-C subfamily serine protease